MADVPRDPYRVLGVSPTASQSEIGLAYRRRVRDLHPDADGTADPRELADVLAAYRLLRDPGRRAAHDREHGRARVTPSAERRRTPVTPGRERKPTVSPDAAQVTEIPVRHHRERREPDLRAGPVRRHR